MARRLTFIVAFRPGFILPTLAAHQARTFQRLTGGRLVVNVVTGGDPVEQRAYGDFLDHDERYDRTEEFLQVFRSAWNSSALVHEGRYYRVQRVGGPADAGRSPGDAPDEQVPEIFFGGASQAAERVAAGHADVHLSWGNRSRCWWPGGAGCRPWPGRPAGRCGSGCGCT